MPHDGQGGSDAGVRMHFKSTLTTRSQTTLPSAVRQFLGIESGETVYYTLDSQRDVVLLTGRPLRQSPEDAKVIKTADGRFAVSMPDFDRVLAHQQAHDCSLDDAFRAVSPRAMKLEEQRDA